MSTALTADELDALAQTHERTAETLRELARERRQMKFRSPARLRVEESGDITDEARTAARRILQQKRKTTR